jgi:hypothetical protein
MDKILSINLNPIVGYILGLAVIVIALQVILALAGRDGR